MPEPEDRDSFLDAVLIGGRERVVITIVDHDEAWPGRFEELRRRVETALGAHILAVEHIGSTSVPGLAAKPIIDLLLTVVNVDDEPAYGPALVEAGFVLRVREPGHRLFRTPDRDAHLHVYEPTNSAVADYLSFRDWLRGSAADRDLYAATKRDLARQDWSDMNAYADAKSDVIRAILARARAAQGPA